MNARVSSTAMGASLALSAGVHAYVIDVHLEEWWLSGAFFVVAATIQALCAYLVLTARNRRDAAAAAGMSALLIGTWVLSRTVGIPFGPHAGVAEPVGGADLLSTVAESITVGLFLFTVNAGHSATVTVSRRWRRIAVLAVTLTFGLGTAAASAMPRHGHAHETQAASVDEHRCSPPHDVERRAPTDETADHDKDQKANEPHAHSDGHHHGHEHSSP